MKDRFWKVNSEMYDLDYSTKITSKDLLLFQKAVSLAEQSDHIQFRVGSIIASGSKILARKTNEYKTHPLQRTYNDKFKDTQHDRPRCSSFIHAEINSLIQARKQPKFHAEDCTIYIGRILKNDSIIASSMPCHSCFSAIKDFGVNRIVCYDNFSRIVSFENFI